MKSDMKRVSIGRILLIVLMVVNVAALTAIAFGAYKMSKHRKHRQAHKHEKFHGPKALFRELSLTEDQKVWAQQFHNEFKSEMDGHHQTMRKLHNEIEMALINGSEKYLLDSLAMETGLIYAEMKKHTFGFVLKMKSICTEEQMVVLNKHIKKSIKGVEPPYRNRKLHFNH